MEFQLQDCALKLEIVHLCMFVCTRERVIAHALFIGIRQQMLPFFFSPKSY